MPGWVREPKPPHHCVKPRVERGHAGGVWRCTCKKLWVHRTGWWLKNFPLSFQRTAPEWHKARLRDKLRWMFSPGGEDGVDS